MVNFKKKKKNEDKNFAQDVIELLIQETLWVTQECNVIISILPAFSAYTLSTVVQRGSDLTSKKLNLKVLPAVGSVCIKATFSASPCAYLHISSPDHSTTESESAWSVLISSLFFTRDRSCTVCGVHSLTSSSTAIAQWQGKMTDFHCVCVCAGDLQDDRFPLCVFVQATSYEMTHTREDESPSVHLLLGAVALACSTEILSHVRPCQAGH